MRIQAEITTVAWLLAATTAAGCHAEHHREHKHGSFHVTSALRSDQEITSDYVCQIHSIQHIELRALERGYLQDIFIDEGQPVKRGQRMFQIMPTIVQAELQKAEAEAEFAKIEYENTKRLAERNVVSKNELALTKAKLDKARADVDLSRVHRNLTEVRAPFDGIMGRLHVRRGSLLEEGELLTTLSDNREMWVYFNVTETEYLAYKARATEGPPKVQLVMANGKTFDYLGIVETIEAEFNNETGTIAFRATFPNPDDLLRHGATGKVVMTTPLDKALVIPQKATFEVLDKRYVFVVGDDEVVHAREITVANELPHLYVLSAGLEESERFLLEGLRKVRDGERVEAKFSEPAEVYANLEIPLE